MRTFSATTGEIPEEEEKQPFAKPSPRKRDRKAEEKTPVLNTQSATGSPLRSPAEVAAGMFVPPTAMGGMLKGWGGIGATPATGPGMPPPVFNISTAPNLVNIHQNFYVLQPKRGPHGEELVPQQASAIHPAPAAGGAISHPQMRGVEGERLPVEGAEMGQFGPDIPMQLLLLQLMGGMRG